jgi:hypothetical protein
MNKIELLVPNSKIKKHKHKQFVNYTIFNFTRDTYDVGDLSILYEQSPTSPGAKSYRNKRTYKKFEDVIKYRNGYAKSIKCDTYLCTLHPMNMMPLLMH